MDLQFDQFGNLRKIDALATPAGITAPPSCAPGATVLDWRSLAARLAAAHATRHILAEQLRDHQAASGSFAPALAPGVTACLVSASRPDTDVADKINQEPKADGKTPGPIEQNSKGEDPTAVRGLV